MPPSSTRPRTEVSHGPRTGLRQKGRRNGPRWFLWQQQPARRLGLSRLSRRARARPRRAGFPRAPCSSGGRRLSASSSQAPDLPAHPDDHGAGGQPVPGGRSHDRETGSTGFADNGPRQAVPAAALRAAAVVAEQVRGKAPQITVDFGHDAAEPPRRHRPRDAGREARLAAGSEARRMSSAATWSATAGSPAMQPRPGSVGTATVPPSARRPDVSRGRPAVRAGREGMARTEAVRQHGHLRDDQRSAGGGDPPADPARRPFGPSARSRPGPPVHAVTHQAAGWSLIASPASSATTM